MPEILQLLAGSLILLAVGFAGFRGGRDTAERRAYYTISELRRGLRVARLDNDRLVQAVDRLERQQAAARIPTVKVPEWMGK
jgi:hypothetical protein